jgi:hypothetical protein
MIQLTTVHTGYTIMLTVPYRYSMVLLAITFLYLDRRGTSADRLAWCPPTTCWSLASSSHKMWGEGVHRTSQPMARQLTGKWTNSMAANRWESQFLTQDVEGGGAQDQPTNGKATNG